MTEMKWWVDLCTRNADHTDTLDNEPKSSTWEIYRQYITEHDI